MDPNGAGGFDCSNLNTWLTQYLPPESNDPSCQPGELLVSPETTGADAIDKAFSVEGTGLCSTTPIGAGLEQARVELARLHTEDRYQYALLITDGDDNCDGDAGYPTDSLGTADALAAAGVTTFVVGFDGSGEGIDELHLNNLACAGRTAKDWNTQCEQVGASYRAKAGAPRQFLIATDAAALDAAFESIVGEICCGCEVD